MSSALFSMACHRWRVSSITLCHFAFKLTCNWLHISSVTKGYSRTEHAARCVLAFLLDPGGRKVNFVMTLFFFTEGLAFIVRDRDQKLNYIGNSSACREVITIGYMLMVVSVTLKFLGTKLPCTLG